MASSHIITSLDSALKYARGLRWVQSGYDPRVANFIKTGIRSLQSLLICLGRLDEGIYPGLESYVRDFDELPPIGSLLPRWEDLRMNCERLYGAWKWVVAAEDELSNGGIQLGADELITIIICVRRNVSDFLGTLDRIAPYNEAKNGLQVFEAFDVQMRFIKHLLRFTMQMASAEELLLLHIQPIALKAAFMFSQCTIASFEDVYSDPERHFLAWYKEVESKCAALNLMAADPQVWQAYARALTAIRHAPTLPTATDEEEEEQVDGEEEELVDGEEEEEEEEDILKALLDSFVSLLWDILRRQSESRVKDQYKLIYEKLRSSRAIWNKNGMDKSRRGQIGVLICDAGAFIFLLHQTYDPAWFEHVLERFDVFHAQFQLQTIPSFKIDSTSIEEISDDGNERDVIDDSSPTSNHQHPQVVGFKEDELQSLLDRLTTASKELCIVPICGMAGIGKTTLALKLYNHPLMERFQARAWCPVSQVPDKKKVLVQLLNQIQPGDYSRETEDDLANILRQSLKGRRYLILLDDVWSAHAWEIFEASFPNDSTSSRVILTSRCHDIVPQPHLLRLRSVSECFEILHKKLSHNETWDTELVMQIAKKCNGLPLTVTLVAGLLATSEQGSWKGILDHLSSGGVSGGAGSTMELSYRHLPDYLQPCFLYFGAFLEDEKVSVNRLIRLWMAEGFVKKGDQSRRIEDVAREYVEKLIERSLLMPVQSRSIGGVKSCRIHDVVHDFCRSKAKQENLFHLLLQSQDQLSDFNEPRSLQRLFVHSSADHFVETRLFCPRAQSLLFFDTGVSYSYIRDISFIIQVFHMLKVLDIYQFDLGAYIPSDIGLLTQLRYLAITTRWSVIPSSLGNLSSLETFMANIGVDEGKSTLVSFPDTFWNLQKLRYLCIRGCRCTLPVENLDNSPTLSELETLDGVWFYSNDGSMEKQMKKFPNLRTFICGIMERERVAEKFPKIVIPGFLSQLEELHVCAAEDEDEFELGSSAENLIKLTLEGVEMSREDVAVIGKYPNLEVLILSEILYLGNTLEMEEEEFIKLRILKLMYSQSLERWNCFDDQASCLEKLVIKYCSNLEEIPSLFGDISTLEHISIVGCSSTLESAARIIQEAQKGWGNCVQVNIESSKY